VSVRLRPPPCIRELESRTFGGSRGPENRRAQKALWVRIPHSPLCRCNSTARMPPRRQLESHRPSEGRTVRVRIAPRRFAGSTPRSAPTICPDSSTNRARSFYLRCAGLIPARDSSLWSYRWSVRRSEEPKEPVRFRPTALDASVVKRLNTLSCNLSIRRFESGPMLWQSPADRTCLGRRTPLVQIQHARFLETWLSG
jgi:hypothetical protein